MQFPTSNALTVFSVSLARKLSLTKLAPYVPTMILSFLVWNLTTVLASIISPLVSTSYNRLSKRNKAHWNARVTSTLHSILILYFNWPLLVSKGLDKDRAYGWDPRAGPTAAIACGYFIWDIIETTTSYEGIGFLLHGVACFAVYFFSFRPFLVYYSPRFLMWEISTPFLNVHWFLDKLNLTGSWLQLANGLVLLSLFSGVRLVYGGYQSVQFCKTLWEIRHRAPTPLLLAYASGNILLQGLNWFWFYKMIAALRKRFSGPEKVGGEAKKE